MLEALCRSSGTTLDIRMSRDGPPITKRTSGLMPTLDRPLACDTVLDISHESLIRQWQALKDWVRGEAASAEQYREIERRARRWDAGRAAFLDGTDLDVALAWREREHPAAPWLRAIAAT